MKIALRKLTATAVLLGILLLAAGFAYDVVFAGLPYQDPTPEMTLRYNHQKILAERIMQVGGLVFAVGIVTGVVCFLTSRFPISSSERVP